MTESAPPAVPGPGVPRRTLLQGAAIVSLALTTGCHPASPRVPAGVAAAAARPRRADWQALAASIDGDVIRRQSLDYGQEKRLFNPRFDHVRPLAIVEATSAHDVKEAIEFARRFDLRARPRSGGHSYVGASTVDDGIVIDVGRIKSTHFHASSGLATIGAGAGLYRVHAALAPWANHPDRDVPDSRRGRPAPRWWSRCRQPRSRPDL